VPDSKLKTRSRLRARPVDADPIRVTSPSFADGDPIPRRYSKDGGNLSPPLAWSNLPAGTASLALVCVDPRGPRGEPFALWVLYNIPPSLPALPEGVPKVPLPQEVPGAAQGVNDTGQVGFDGPAPPRGHPPHRYEVRVYALDTGLDLSLLSTKTELATKTELEQAMEGHVLAAGILIGTLKRPARP
jgi:Raf kinase inhibitor-like YbhB/YbcL family protein